MHTRDMGFYLRRAAQGVFVSLFLVTALFAPRRGEIVGRLLLYETMPGYRIDEDMKEFLGLGAKPAAAEVLLAVPLPGEAAPPEDNLVAEEIISVLPEEDAAPDSGIIGITYDIYEDGAGPEPDAEPAGHTYSEAPAEADLSAVKGLAELESGFYTVDAQTGMTSADFDVNELMKADLSLGRSGDGPKVLVFHTHSFEMYADSADESEGVLGLGRELCEVLRRKYGISSLHSANRYDLVDGASQVLGAYERMEPDITGILAENPSIELAIDLHRDGVKGDRRLVTEIGGKSTAQIMFVNGLSKLYRGGVLMNIDTLPNPNRKTNLALSLRAQLAGNKLYPGLMRKIYLNAYRYSLHMLPKSLLVEVGAQTNTKAEAWNAIEPLADILAAAVLE